MEIRHQLLFAALIVIYLEVTTLTFAGSVHVYGGDFDLPIPSNLKKSKGWMPDAVVDIPDHYVISDLDVRIGLTHTNVFDLQIFLQSPQGDCVCLNMYNFDEFFIGADYSQTIFDDEAAIPIEQGTPPFIGRYKPKEGNSLEVFDKQNSFGRWRLRIYDMWEWDTGKLESFQLIITAPEPGTAILFVLGAGLLRFSS